MKKFPHNFNTNAADPRWTFAVVADSFSLCALEKQNIGAMTPRVSPYSSYDWPVGLMT